MKILILSDDFPPETSGASRIAFNLAQNFISKGHRVFVITTTQNKNSVGTSVSGGIEIHRLYSKYHERWRAYRSLYNIGVIEDVKKIMNEIRPDVVHAHNIHYHISYHSLRIAKESGARVFLTAHDVMLFHYGKLTEFINRNSFDCPDEINYRVSSWQLLALYQRRFNPSRNFIIRRYLRYVDGVFAVSNELKKVLEQNRISKVRVIRNGIDVSAWDVPDEKVALLRKRFNLEDRKIVMFGGRISGVKGEEQIILAMARVVKKVPRAVLFLVGAKNKHMDIIIRMAKENGIAENIVFSGWLEGDELKAAYHVSDLIIAPSICFDSFPTVILEAMACKKPAIATCFGGAKEIIEEGGTGFIVNPFNINLMADRISSILVDSDFAESMGRAGYERVRREFTLDVQAESYLKVFRSI